MQKALGASSGSGEVSPWSPQLRPTPLLPDTPPSPTSPVVNLEQAGPGGQAPSWAWGVSDQGSPSSAPSPSKKWQFLESVNLFPAVVAKKGKKKNLSLVSRKLTTTSENRVNMMDAFIPLNIQQRPEAHVCHTRFGATGSGPGGPGPSLGPGVVPPGPTLGFLEGSVYSPSPFPGIMALDINDSR